MKRFLPIFILFGFLFGQDVLLLKSGKNYKGRFITKDGEKIIFRLEGEKNINAFSINDVDIIMTGDGDFYYPFDMPIKKESSSFGKDVLYLKSGEFLKGVFIKKLGNDILFQIEGENISTKSSIDLVEIIETNNRKYYYPFNIPKKLEFRKFSYRELPNVIKIILGSGVCYISLNLFIILIDTYKPGM